MSDEYLHCPDCGQQTLLDSGPLGLNCFSEPCLAESTATARRMMADWQRREAARLLALAAENDA